jgi:NhaP-type Na+/H+ or K+/H+ antiporter
MIFSIGLILILGFIIGWLLSKIKIPGLVGMIIVGLLIGPYCLGLIDEKILSISTELRQVALVIILTRSGLNLDIDSLKKIGRPAILMSFIPATLEIIGTTLISQLLLEITIFESILLGTVLAAVSPAVVSPRMIKLIEERFGEKHQVPKLILAGSSVDDIYVIVLFYTFLGLVGNNTFDFVSITMIPVTIILGVLLGIIVGFILSYILKKTNFKTTINILIIISSSFLMIGLENMLKDYISISSLLGIMVIGIILLFRNKEQAKQLSDGYNNLWIFFEIILFVLVGATVDFSYAINNGLIAILILMIGLLFRTLGVLLCLIKTKLTFKERLFTILAYIPKATVQASIGGIALSLGLSCGSIILTVSVISILITAPIGAILIDNLSSKLLDRTDL